MSKPTKKHALGVVENATSQHETSCRIKHKRISTLLEASQLSDKMKAYDRLASIMRDFVKEVLSAHNRNTIPMSGNSLLIEIFNEDKEAFILYEGDEMRYRIVWTCDGIAELSDGFFNRFIEFNNIEASPSLVNLTDCYCNTNMVDFITLAEICESVIISKAELIGIAEGKRHEWHRKASESLKLAKLFKEAM